MICFNFHLKKMPQPIQLRIVGIEVYKQGDFLEVTKIIQMKSKDGSSKYTKRNKRNNVHQNITRMDERAVLCFSVFSKFSPVSIYHLAKRKKLLLELLF